MMQRCYRANSERYPRYGGRGIKVCDEWHDVKTFIKWAEENGFSEELSIERIDLNGDYEPSNCKWIPLEEQRWNTSYNVWYEYKGLRLTTMQWTRKLNIPIKETSSYRKNDIPFTDIIKNTGKTTRDN